MNKLAELETSLFEEAPYMTVSPIFNLYIPYLTKR